MSLHRLATVSLLAVTSTLAVQGTLTTQRLRTLTAEQEEILDHMSIVYLDDGQGGTAKTIRVEGVNLQVVNGLGATNGYPLDPGSVDDVATETNGVGNLIIGYNEFGSAYGDDRTGSHNIVAGARNNFFAFGGLVVGTDNVTRAPFGTVTGGRHNVAAGPWSHVSGGGGFLPYDHASKEGNLADGLYSSVSGGVAGVAGGKWSSVTGGNNNDALGEGSSVSGGQNIVASAPSAWAAGGLDEEASLWWSSVVGGCLMSCP